MADYSARIAEIEDILSSGVTQTTVDGVQTTFDHASLRQELARLKRLDDATLVRKPLFTTIDLSGAT